MTRSFDDIEYLHLPTAERLLLAQDILDSVVADAHGDPLTPSQMAEIERRCADIDSGKVQCLPWNQVRTRFLSGK